MRNYLYIIFLILTISSWGQNQNEKNDSPSDDIIDQTNSNKNDYSKEFFDHFKENNLTLKGDTILFPAESRNEVVLIPKYIPKNQNILFDTKKGSSISIKQLNYTDIEFQIQYEDQKFSGKASLFPYFYLGMETVEFSDGEYVISRYFVTETDCPCLDFIGLGNQNIAKENPENIYALIVVSGNTCENELSNLTNKKLKTVANTRL